MPRPAERAMGRTAARSTRRCAAYPSLLLLLAASLVAAPAAAWGPVGHQAVGAVADALLDPRAQAAVAELLADDRDPQGRASGRHSLAAVAGWADEIRGGPGDHPHWHYDNRPVCGPPVDESTWCPGGECASAQITAMLAVLADPAQPRAQRRIALKWVVHLAGDLHQPLHAAALAEGGNGIHVLPNGNARQSSYRQHGPRGHGHAGESLHAFWDTYLVNLALHPQDGRIPEAALDKLIRRAHALDQSTVAAAPERWAEESNDIARDFALNLDGVDCTLGNGRGAGEGPTVRLSRDYVKRGRQIVQERIALAGARLARVLNQVLDGAH